MDLHGNAAGILSAMKARMRQAQAALEEHLERRKLTRGMTVRIHGDHLIVGRPVPKDDAGGEHDDRIRLTQLGASSWGLSVKRHTGRWEQTPFSGTMPEMVETVWTFMQHLVTP